jgi:hydroxyacylglutathione hydrolase
MLASQLYRSVFEVLPPLPDFTEIFPGHGAGSLCGKAIGSRRSSTLGFERRFNPALKAMPQEQWTENLLRGMPLAPPYFKRMKQINSTGPRLLGCEMPGQKRFRAAEVHQRLCDHCMVVDVRPKEAFASAHVPGSINIPIGPALATWAGWVLPYDKRLVLMASQRADVPEVVKSLIRVGLDQIEGYIEDGIDAWENHGFGIAQLESLSAHDLSKRLSAPASQRPFVLDVRTDGEWQGGHIESAHHIHGGLLQERIDEVPRDRAVAVICGSGYRGSIAASFLKSQGYSNIANVLGGMSAWTGAGLPAAH